MVDDMVRYQSVRANDGDCLCGIAARFGFVNCQRVRQVPANQPLLNRPLRNGDVVQVPTLERRTEGGRQVEERHVFRRRGIPAPMIRFVHGSRLTPCRLDHTLTFLNISNYVSNLGGRNGTNPFPPAFGFNVDGDEDPDAFKIEVVDPKAGSDSVNTTLEALKPRYRPDGSIDRDADGREVYEQFAAGDSDSNKRSIRVTCQKISNRNRTRLRSRYLRLVVDDKDFEALSGNPVRTDGTAQGLLVTDMADGNNGPNDRIEILDQRVRATYELRNCPAGAGQQKCRVVAELPFENIRRRIKLCVHVFKESVGGANAANITEQNVRLRTMKWFRRSYAQISMAPKLVPCREGIPEIEFIDPPADNMITISQEHGNPVSAAGGPYQLTFRLGLPPGEVADAEAAATGAGLTAADARPNVTVTLTNGWTPEQVSGAIVTAVGALAGGIFRAQSFRNARAFTAVNRSYDVLITRTDNRRVMIENENLTAGAGITIDVARVNTANVNGNLPANWVGLNPELRRLVREAPGTDDRLDFYICREFNGFGGLGLIPHTDLGADYRPDSPMRYACFVMAAFNVMDGSDNYPWIYPHEAGHVLPDAFHIDNASVHASTCLMWSQVLSQQHPVDASKRIFDPPVNVRYECWDPAQPAVGASTWVTGSLAQRFRNRSGSVTDNW
ncbi:MAG: hypothetical protein FJ106_07055 [Deltaproteobacteria bacterium]|nr:hypothetical protein [Deltaproteobacteria bacterium]